MRVPRTVVVTRERWDAQRWVKPLSAAGFEVLQVPWLDLVDIADTGVVPPALAWDQYHAVMCVSAKAARVLQRDALGWGDALKALWHRGAGPRLWAPGPGTAQQLIDLGIPADRIDAPPATAAQFDSEHLWQAVCGQVHADFKLLIIRGDMPESRLNSPQSPGAKASGRDALRAACEAAGGHVEECVVYRRGLPQWLPQEISDWHRALSNVDACWLASSSTALEWGHALAIEQGLPADWCSARRVLATHPRIQATALALGWGQVSLSRPDYASVVAALQHDPVA